MAKKCGAFFNWINQVDYAIFAEQLWKNKMMAVVGERFPELNAEEQQKLIDRDWKIMAPERKQVNKVQFRKYWQMYKNKSNTNRWIEWSTKISKGKETKFTFNLMANSLKWLSDQLFLWPYYFILILWKGSHNSAKQDKKIPPNMTLQ